MTAILQRHRDQLIITAKEQCAYEFLARGPAKRVDPTKRSIYELFTIKENQKSSMADVMVNCLSLALGAPRESNHLHDRIFNLGNLHQFLCPGSEYNRMNMDCGFTLGYSGYQQGLDLTNNLNIMGNHRKYRLRLNTMTWAALCFGAILDEPGMMAAAQNHFLNYIPQEAQDLGVNRRGPVTQAENTRHYMLTRAQVFCNLLETDGHIAREDGLLFLTESILTLWLRIYNNGSPRDRPRDLVGSTGQNQTVINYETYLQRHVFDDVSRRIREVADNYQRSALQNDKIRVISDLQKEQAMYLSSPLLSKDQVNESYAALETRMPLYEAFTALLPLFKVLQAVPLLIHMYRTLNNIFAYRLTSGELHLPLETPDTIAQFRKDWEAFKAVWGTVRESLGNLNPVCAHQGRYQVEIPVIDDSTPLATLITEDVDGVNAIMRLVESLKGQEAVLKLLDPDLDSDEDGPGHRSKRSKEVPSLSEALRKEGGDLDWDRIEKKILELSNGKARISTQYITTIFPTMKSDTDFNIERCDETAGGTDAMSKLRQFVQIIRPSPGRFESHLSTGELKRLRTRTRCMSKADLILCANILGHLAQHLMAPDPADVQKTRGEGQDPTQRIGDIIESAFGPATYEKIQACAGKEFVRKQLHYLRNICSIIVAKFDTCDFLFSDIPDELDQPVQEDVKSRFQEELRIASEDPKTRENMMTLLQRAVETRIVWTERWKYRPEESLKTILLKSVAESNSAWQSSIRGCVPDSLRVGNYGTFLRIMHLECGKAAGQRKGQRYQEKLSGITVPIDPQEEDWNSIMHPPIPSFATSAPPIELRPKQQLAPTKPNRPSYCKEEPCGIWNLGHTCFAAATIQCMFATKTMRQTLLSPTSHNGVARSLQRAAEQLLRHNGRSIALDEFMQRFRERMPRFRPGRQEDAHDFFTRLIDMMPELGTPIRAKVDAKLCCTTCHIESTSAEQYYGVSLPLADGGERAQSEVTKLLQKLVRREVIERTCEKCPDKYATKDTIFTEAPAVLMLHLKRFTEHLGRVKKRSEAVEIPTQLTLDCKAGSVRFELRAICNHIGQCIQWGLYTATIKYGANWYELSDSRVKVTQLERRSTEAYLLFYERPEIATPQTEVPSTTLECEEVSVDDQAMEVDVEFQQSAPPGRPLSLHVGDNTAPTENESVFLHSSVEVSPASLPTASAPPTAPQLQDQDKYEDVEIVSVSLPTHASSTPSRTAQIQPKSLTSGSLLPVNPIYTSATPSSRLATPAPPKSTQSSKPLRKPHPNKPPFKRPLKLPSTSQTQSPTPQPHPPPPPLPKRITLRKFNQHRGGTLLIIPATATLTDLHQAASSALGIPVVTLRMLPPSEALVQSVAILEKDEVVQALTAEEEKEFQMCFSNLQSS
ncbi:hypothetical protein HDV00_012360 [Rhizophlyctis rosea]|nr:hypothetical protein HDV00_012360 [Rhizophlyctis rosea]